MKIKHKALLLSLCAVLLVAATVFGTLAYLTDTEAVTNTFAVGSVGLSLDEADVKPDGTLDTNDRVQANEYHLLPGHTYIKDPTVTVDAKSEDAYIRMVVKVENIDQLKLALPDSKYYGADGVFLLQNLVTGWDNNIWVYEGYTADGNNGIYEFRYVGNDIENPGNGIVVKSETATVLPDLFTHITVPGEIDNTHLAYLDNVNIVVTAHAIQADGFADADAAWTAFGTQHPATGAGAGSAGN